MNEKNTEILMKGIHVSIAILGIIVLEGYALYKGINGVALTTCIAAVAGLGGYEIDKVIKVIKGGKE